MALKQLFTPKVKEQLTSDPYKSDVVILIDVSFLAYKSAYALKNLKTKEGINSGHVFGAAKQIVSILKEHARNKTACLVFAFDGKPIHRLEIYPEYKAGRVNKLGYDPIKDVKTLCSSIKGLTIWNMEYEADDVIGAFAHSFKGNAPILVFSKDRDLWQLVPQVKIIYGKGELIGKEEVEKKFNVPPNKISIHKAVFGDPSDNIPRIPRIRSSYLLPLVQASNNPEEFFKNLENHEQYKIPDKTRKKIGSYREQVEKNFKLAKLKVDCSFIKKEGGDAEMLTKVLEKFECKSILSEVEKLT